MRSKVLLVSIAFAEMTVSIGAELIRNRSGGGSIAELNAALAATDPELLCHVVDRLRSAGNAAFKSRAYGGRPSILTMHFYSM